MGNYLNNETKDLEVSEPKERDVNNDNVTDITEYDNAPNESSKKEIKLSSVKNTPVSEIVAKALNEAFAITGMELIHQGELTNNTLFKDIKVISVEDINNDLPGSILALQDSDLVFMDMKMPKTQQEKMFDLHVEENQSKVFNNPNSLAEHIKNEFAKMGKLDQPKDIFDSNIGDVIEYEGHNYLVVYKDANVLIIKLHGYREILTSKQYITLDLPR